MMSENINDQHKLTSTGTPDGYLASARSVQSASGNVKFSFTIDQSNANIRIGFASTDTGSGRDIGFGFQFESKNMDANIRSVVGGDSGTRLTGVTYNSGDRFILSLEGDKILLFRNDIRLGEVSHSLTGSFFIIVRMNEVGAISDTTLSIDAPKITSLITRQRISGTANPDSLVQLFAGPALAAGAESDTPLYTTTASMTGNWVIDPNPALAEGEHVFFTAAVNIDGIKSARSTTGVTVVIKHNALSQQAATQLHKSIMPRLRRLRLPARTDRWKTVLMAPSLRHKRQITSWTVRRYSLMANYRRIYAL